MKNFVKWLVVILIIAYFVQHLPCKADEILMFVPIVVLILALMLMKRWFPFMFNTMKKISLWSAKFMATTLWQRPERKGGATIRSQKIRWRP